MDRTSHGAPLAYSEFGAAEAARAMGPNRCLGVEIPDGRSFSLRTTGTSVELVDGVSDSPLVVTVGTDAFGSLLAEDRSIFGLLYAGQLQVTRGSFDQFAAWEAALQALLYDRPVYDRAAAASIADVEIARSFEPDHDRAEMAEFLDQCGFVHVRRVFGSTEIAVLSDEIDRLREAAAPDDRASWWATDHRGDDVCCRVTYMADRSAAVASLAADERLQSLASLGGSDLRCAHDRVDGISVVIKHPEIVAGLSDLPWHRDCGLGGHPVLCPGVNLGIQLDRADAEHGQLWFLPGSHRHGGPMGDPVENGYRVLAVDTEPGDVTMHFGHTLHAAPPPTNPSVAGRRAVYVGFSGPALFERIGPGQAYNDVIYGTGDGRVRNVAEQAAG